MNTSLTESQLPIASEASPQQELAEEVGRRRQTGLQFALGVMDRLVEAHIITTDKDSDIGPQPNIDEQHIMRTLRYLSGAKRRPHFISQHQIHFPKPIEPIIERHPHYD